MLATQRNKLIWKMENLSVFLTLLISCWIVSHYQSTALRCRDDPNSHFNDYTIAGKVACMNDQIDYMDIITQKRHRKRRVANYKKKWPKSPDGFVYVPYMFDIGLPLTVQLTMFNAVVRFNAKSCIRFRFKTLDDVDYILIKSKFNSGCSSYVGKIGGEQTLNLEYPGCDKTGIAIHELLHALGFDHTMVRLDVGKHLKVNFTNIQERYIGNFLKHSEGEMDIYGEDFCFRSVMMYGRKDFAKDRDYDVLTPFNETLGSLMGNRESWAECDIKQVNRMYHCYDYLDK